MTSYVSQNLGRQLLIQSTLAILNMRYFEFRAMSNFLLVSSPFTVYFPIKCLAISASIISNYSLSGTNFLVPWSMLINQFVPQLFASVLPSLA